MSFDMISRIIFLSLAAAGSISSAQEPNDLWNSAVQVTCTVGRTSQIPNPRDAPYQDCITYIELIRDLSDRSQLRDTRVLAAFWAFKKRLALPASSYKQGDRLRVSLVPISMIDKRTLSTMQVDDVNDFELPVFWALNAERLPTNPVPAEARDAASRQARKTSPPEPPKQILPRVDSTASTAGPTSPTIKRILNVLQAHGGQYIANAANDFVFSGYRYLYTPGFWEPPEKPAGQRPFTPPLEAIRDYDRQCTDLGIELILVFPPRSAALYPGLATNSPYDPATDGRIDIYFQQFLARLDSIGVRYVDPTSRLLAERYISDDSGQIVPIYEQHKDSHWRPEAARIIAEEVALSIRDTNAWRVHMKSGKMAREKSPNESTLYDVNAQGSLIQLLGDSFLEYPVGTRNSLWAQLVTEFGMPMNAISIGAGAASMSRRALARNGIAPETKIIVWEVISNVLMNHSRWEKIPVSAQLAYDLLSYPEKMLPAAIRANGIGKVRPYSRRSRDALKFKFDGAAGLSVFSATFLDVPKNKRRRFHCDLQFDFNQRAHVVTIKRSLSIQGVSVSSVTSQHISRAGFPALVPWTVDLESFDDEPIDIELTFEYTDGPQHGSFLILDPQIYGLEPWKDGGSH